MDRISDLDPSVLESIIDKGLSLGSDYVEARLHSKRLFHFYLMNGRLVAASWNESSGVAIRVLVEGGMGFASTDDLDRYSLESALKRAYSGARARYGKYGVSMGSERLGRASYVVRPKRDFTGLSESELIDLVKESTYSIIDLPEKVKLSSFVVSFTAVVEEKIVLTSDGGLVESLIPRVSLFYNISLSSGDRRANKWNQIGGSGGLEVLKDRGLEDNLKSDLDGLIVAVTKAKEPPSGKMDVILSPEIVGLAMHEAVGHPSEADRVLWREAAQAGLSYRIQESGRIGSNLVTVVDDPTIPGSSGFYLYDDEAVPAREKVLIEDGVLKELLHNRETGKAMGVESNGSARSVDYMSEPIVRMSNTYMKPGDYSLEEMIEDVKDGVYIKSYMEWNIDDYRRVARYVGLEAYRISRGRIAEPVTNVVLEISTRDFFSSIDAVGKDLEFYAGTCGKGEPPQPLPVWMGGPHVRLRRVVVG